MSAAVDAALARAHDDAAQPVVAPSDGGRRVRTLAIGDPQAPLETFLRILDANDALGDDGRIRDDTALVSMGDHFDWGKRDEREDAARDAQALLSWLAAHPADQAIVLLGNHDLARVGELAFVDDDTFARNQQRADGIDKADDEANRVFRDETGFFSAELVHRDFSTFRSRQRALVDELLRAHRFRLAYARGDLLFVHAGITLREIDAVGVGLPTPAEIAAALNHALDDAAERRAQDHKPLTIVGVHAPGDALREGSGALYHRPARDISAQQRREGRRYNPRTLPHGIVQVVGHIRDKKCRELLGAWCDDAEPKLGVLRTMSVTGDDVQYRHGVPEQFDPRAATMVFTDGGMNDMRHAPAEYQLFDVERRTAAHRGG